MHNERRRGQRPGHHDQVLGTHNEWRRGQRPGATIKYLRTTTSTAANNGMGTAAKYLVNNNVGMGSSWAKAHVHKTWHEFR
jgi:hypothetical protein